MAGPACIFASAALESVIAHARQEHPRECCGVLLGLGDHVIETAAVQNIAASSDRFLLDPEGHIRARKEARRRGLQIVGFYHSHPHTPAIPSAVDLAEATYPECLYAIVSLAADPPEVCVFSWRDGRFDRVETVARS